MKYSLLFFPVMHLCVSFCSHIEQLLISQQRQSTGLLIEMIFVLCEVKTEFLNATYVVRSGSKVS